MTSKASSPKPLAFRILLLLADGERHGWSLVKELQAEDGDGTRILPGSLYRTLSEMEEDGLIEEAPDALDDADGGRRRYFRLTTLGVQAARAEADRLSNLLRVARSKRALFPEGGTA
jgi:DNA-binding PadR family transcriptional regulator